MLYEQLKLDYIVIHPGTYNYKDKNENKETGLNRIAEQINSLFKDTENSNVKLLLETVAGQGHNLGRKFRHIATIIQKIEKF